MGLSVENFEIVSGRPVEAENGVRCRKCGTVVVPSAEIKDVRKDAAGKLKALPFPCLAHNCGKA